MKPKLLYFSPLPPQESGISDYSVSLLPHLAKHFTVLIVVDRLIDLENSNPGLSPRAIWEKFGPPLLKDFKFFINGVDKIPWRAVPSRLYNFGNNPFAHLNMYFFALRWPGAIILHDFIMYYLAVGAYRNSEIFREKMMALGGQPVIDSLDALKAAGIDYYVNPDASKFPLNAEILDSANQIIVHSQYSYRRILDSMPSAAPRLHRIPMLKYGFSGHKIESRDKILEKYGISKDLTLVCSFGSIASTKQNDKICRAIQLYNLTAPKKMYYLMVGGGDFANQFLGPNIGKTGFVETPEFSSLMAHSDIVTNLRYPSMGETSASLQQAMELGKACVVTNYGSFEELPGDTVIKVSHDVSDTELSEVMARLVEDKAGREKIGARARDLIETEHSPSRIAQQIFEVSHVKRSLIPHLVGLALNFLVSLK